MNGGGVSEKLQPRGRGRERSLVPRGSGATERWLWRDITAERGVKVLQ